MAETATPSQVRVGPQGRVVIPAALRKAAGIDTGDTLVARAEAGRVVLETRAAILARLRWRLRHIPADVSLADELIRDRREEARREETE
ncbi:MAG: AbrB/MazE/SpoVT family DNA-binding domain-containing protein [Chloroflexota bacterium]